MNTHSIFLNYRRIEAKKDAQQLYRELLRHFPEQIFMDAPGTAGGQHFPDLLKRKVQECRVLVAVIGPEWHRLADGSGRVRLAQEDDWVRLEIATALQRGIPVIPALIDGARMPVAEQVPAVLHGLLHHQAVKLDLDDFFDASIEKLCAAIRIALAAETTGTPTPPPRHSRESGNPRTEPALPVVDPRFRGDDGRRGDDGTAEWWKRQIPWATAYGEKGSDEFTTPWADIEIGGVVQRMRWIEPGSFLMGCDPGDPGSFDDEAPQHRVTLTNGFWLADTACTQGLWQAVTGKNPSEFKGKANLPVEHVSWDNVTILFLPKVAKRLGVKVELPTEAEWEFACRAGTQTPFGFGWGITEKHVNFGNSVSRTVPVKDRPANGWGLYQMHGNVWEWCADAPRTYAEHPVTDPDGGQGRSARALRGGSCYHVARRCRSAFRRDYLHNDCYGGIGFRFALRSVQPGR
jgi:formylglycine-generating enzyme required for sulfatase activity